MFLWTSPVMKQWGYLNTITTPTLSFLANDVIHWSAKEPLWGWEGICVWQCHEQHRSINQCTSVAWWWKLTSRVKRISLNWQVEASSNSAGSTHLITLEKLLGGWGLVLGMCHCTIKIIFIFLGACFFCFSLECRNEQLAVAGEEVRIGSLHKAVTPKTSQF